MMTVPHFEHESDEAEWWSKNQHLVEAEFAAAQPVLGPSRASRFLAERRLKRERPQTAPSAQSGDIAKLPRSA
jgi:hypothetical protein